MVNLFWVLVVCCSSIHVALGKLSVHVANASATHNPEFFDLSMQCYVNPNDDTDWRVSFNATLLKELTQFRVKVKVFHIDNCPSGLVEITKFYERSMNFCQGLENGVDTDIIGGFIIMLWSKYSNLPRGCPIKSGSYVLSNATLTNHSVPPIPYLTGRKDAKMLLSFWTAVGKKLVKIMELIFFARFQN